MATKKEQEKQDAIDRIRDDFPEGRQVWTRVKAAERSGMRRIVEVVVFDVSCPDHHISTVWLSYLVAKALGYAYNKKKEGIIINGCGFDAGFEIVHDLEQLFGRKFKHEKL